MYILILVFAIFNYVMQGFGISAKARHRGIEKPWLAWIPYANTWLFGKLSDQYREMLTGEDPGLRKRLLAQKIIYMASKVAAIGYAILWYFGSAALMIVCELAMGEDNKPIVMLIIIALGVGLLFMIAVTLLLKVFYLITQYRGLFDLYRSSNPNTSTLFFVISLVFFFTAIPMSICVFLDRHKEFGMPSKPEEGFVES